MNEAGKFYNALAICYVADLWFIPRNHKVTDRFYPGRPGHGLTLLTKRLEAIQRQAAISIPDHHQVTQQSRRHNTP
jgi:hypothetical protein